MYSLFDFGQQLCQQRIGQGGMLSINASTLWAQHRPWAWHVINREKCRSIATVSLTRERESFRTCIDFIQDRGGRSNYIPGTIGGTVRWYNGSIWCSTVVRLVRETEGNTCTIDKQIAHSEFWIKTFGSDQHSPLFSFGNSHKCKCRTVKLECSCFAFRPIQLSPKKGLWSLYWIVYQSISGLIEFPYTAIAEDCTCIDPW